MNIKTAFRRRSARFFSYQQLPPPVVYELDELKNPICNIYLASDMLNMTDLDEEQRKIPGDYQAGGYTDHGHAE